LLVVDLHGAVGVKDPSELHCADPERFAEQWRAAIEAARPCDEYMIAKLVALTAIEFDRARGPAAKKLGVRVTTLNALVENQRKVERDEARAAHAAEENARAEEACAAAEPRPDAPEIDGAQLLSDLVAFIRRFVVLSDSQAIAIALWIVHTHAFEAADSTPYLAINSAEKRCGKTRLLEVLDLLVARAWLTGRTTGAALIRKVSSDRATLLLDESDAAFNGEKTYAEALRGILNSGHRRAARRRLAFRVGKGGKPRRLMSLVPRRSPASANCRIPLLTGRSPSRCDVAMPLNLSTATAVGRSRPSRPLPAGNRGVGGRQPRRVARRRTATAGRTR